MINLAGSARCWQLLGAPPAPPARGWPPRVRGRGGGGVGVERSGLKSTPMASSRYRLVLRHRLVIPFLLRRSCRHLLHSYFIECFIIINTTANSYPTAAEAAYTDAAAAVQREMLVRCEIEGHAGLRVHARVLDEW